MSCTVTAINPFLETEADIRALVERIALGPQEEVINKIENLNIRYGTDFRCTPTFRWQPKFYDKLNKEAIRLSNYSAKKRKISTYRNAIRNNEWNIKNFLDNIEAIDNDLYCLRNTNAIFQDNTDSVVESLDEYKQTIINTIDIAHEMNPNIKITPYLGTHDPNVTNRTRRRAIGPKTTINFHVHLKDITMKVVVGNSSAEIEIGEIDIMYTVDLITNIMQRIRRANCNNDSFRLSTGIGLHMGHTSNLMGGYYTPIRDNTVFPYISTRGGWNPSMRVEGVDSNGNRFPSSYNNICFGSYAEDITEAFWNGDMMAVSVNLKGWSNLFRVGFTNPLNGYQRLFHGLPEDFNQEDFINSGRLPNIYGEGCWISDNLSRSDEIDQGLSPADSLCAENDCSLRDTCNWYQEVYGTERIVSDMEDEAAMVHNDSNETDRFGYPIINDNEARLIEIYSRRSVI